MFRPKKFSAANCSAENVSAGIFRRKKTAINLAGRAETPHVKLGGQSPPQTPLLKLKIFGRKIFGRKIFDRKFFRPKNFRPKTFWAENFLAGKFTAEIFSAETFFSRKVLAETFSTEQFFHKFFFRPNRRRRRHLFLEASFQKRR